MCSRWMLLSPWAETVLYATKLQDQDPDLKLVKTLPSLIQDAHHKQKHPASAHAGSEKEKRRLESPMDWMTQATKAAEGAASNMENEAHSAESAMKKEASQVANTSFVHSAQSRSCFQGKRSSCLQGCRDCNLADGEACRKA